MPIAVAQQAASPSPTAPSACSVPNAQVRIDTSAHPEYPGRQELGQPDIDADALRVAMKSTYHPKIVHCTAVDGHYLFSVDYYPG